MSVKVTFECDGCFKETEGTSFLKSEFMSMRGTGYGFGSWKHEGVKDVVPQGWIAFDPYTQCCYCPDCWADIEQHSAEKSA